MTNNIVIDISPTHVAKFSVSSYGPMKLQDSLKCKCRKKEVIDEVFFAIR